MTALPEWLAPGAVADRLFDVRAEAGRSIGFGLVRPRRSGLENTMSQIAFAKLNPVKPVGDTPRTACGWPVTARDYRIIPAPGVPDVGSFERLFSEYDAAVQPHQKLLGAVFTFPFVSDVPVHDGFGAVLSYAALRFGRERRLTSLVVAHAPCDQLAEEAPHAHAIVLGRTHRASGWGPTHPDLAESEHAMWAEDWADFSARWALTLGQ